MKHQYRLNDLQEEWIEISTKWGANKEDVLQIFSNVVSKYQHKNRHYHSIQHIVDMMFLANKYRTNISCYITVYFAIWFHDTIQEMGKDSERESAELAISELTKLNVPKAIMHNVFQLIMATKQHDAVNVQDGNIFIDIDMSILGSRPNVYYEYMKNCRKEYPVPNFLYKRGRKKFLKGLLKKEYIFQTDLFREEYELQARRNIDFELLNI